MTLLIVAAVLVVNNVILHPRLIKVFSLYSTYPFISKLSKLTTNNTLLLVCLLKCKLFISNEIPSPIKVQVIRDNAKHTKLRSL
jgi:hypothetical protein